MRTQPNVFYMGATGGGVWKTENAGITWTPITDGQIADRIDRRDRRRRTRTRTSSTSAPAARRSDRTSSSGRGVYKSTDAGKTWQFAGLKDVGQIGQLKIHPTNPDIV